MEQPVMTFPTRLPRFTSVCNPMKQTPSLPSLPPSQFKLIDDQIRAKRIFLGGCLWILIGSALITIGCASGTVPILGIGIGCLVLGASHVVYGVYKLIQVA